MPWGWFHTSEGVLTVPFKGYRPIICVYWLQRVEPPWLRIYNWSTAWPITFKEIISFSKYYVTLGHVLLIAFVNFNVSLLHPMRKGLLKLIVVRIWFPTVARPSFMVCYHEHLCQLSTVDTCATALHCIMLNIINNLFI